MKAIVANPSVRGALEIGEAPEPEPDSNEAVIRVTALSLNRGELRRAQASAPGTQIGWDLTGVIETAARDGSGPKAGTRVVGLSLRMQGWAERVALPTTYIAAIPDGVSDADAATLPVAGLTALYCLERCERLLASKVLITGASGGVGYFACQLARLMGAHTTAQLRRPDHRALVEETGIDVVAISPDGTGLDGYGPFRGIIDGVGGDTLSNLLPLLDDGGRAILYGISEGPEARFPVRGLMMSGTGRIEGFYLYRESEFESATRGLDRLLALLADGRLKTLIARTGSWEEIGEVAEGLIERSFPGKAVLTL